VLHGEEEDTYEEEDTCMLNRKCCMVRGSRGA